MAHGECREANGELGGEPEQSGWRRRSRRREVGDELGEDVRGLSAGRGSVRGRRTKWRSFWARRRGVGWPMAMATASGVDELCSGVCAREGQGRGESAASEGEETGASGHRRGVARRGRGSRRWRGRVLGGGALSPSSAYWQR